MTFGGKGTLLRIREGKFSYEEVYDREEEETAGN